MYYHCSLVHLFFQVQNPHALNHSVQKPSGVLPTTLPGVCVLLPG